MRNRNELLVAAMLILCITVFGTLLCERADISPVPEEAKEEVRSEEAADIFIPVFHMKYTMPDGTELQKAKARYDYTAVILDEYDDILDHMETVMLPTVSMKLTDLGKYYITGYTAWELGGSTATASGATCHKAASYEDSFYNPTTCAIDPAIHDFGDLFYIEKFGCFIAEDTGSAVKQKHLDLYYGTTYEDNQEALTITGYYTVYSVEFIYGETSATNYDIQSMVADKVIGWRLTDEMKGIETDIQKGPIYETN